MKVGRLGAVNFEVSSEVIKTIRDFSITHQATKQTHARHNRKGLVEFTGVDPAAVDFKILLSSYLGAPPLFTFAILKDYLENGKALILTIGGQTIGSYRWMITKLKASGEHYDTKGNVTTMDVSVSLIEYLKE